MPSKALPQDSWSEYEVTSHTADMQGAGTDADVSLVMFGTSGEHYQDHEYVYDICIAWASMRAWANRNALQQEATYMLH